MIISDVKYVGMSSTITCSMSACLAMLLDYYKVDIPPQSVADMFESIFLSKSFREWNMTDMDPSRQGAGEMMACAQFMIETRIPKFVADIVSTDMEKVRLSYIKRNMPVIVTGKFPLKSGKVSNSVIIKGYIDDYLVVNDPRGNANSGYSDRYGENIVYRISDLDTWTGSRNTMILRIISK